MKFLTPLISVSLLILFGGILPSCDDKTIQIIDEPPPPPPPEIIGEEVFDLTKLHQIEIELDPNLFAQIDSDHESRVSANIVFDGVRLDDIGLRGKCGIGSCTSIFDKVGFSLKFDEFVEGHRLFGLKKLIVNNSIQDTSYSNELVGQELARRAGIPAPRVSHAEVKLNGELYGLFVLVESIDKQFLRRTFGESNDEGNLYEGPCCGDFVFNGFLPELKDEEDGRTRDDLFSFNDFLLSVTPQEFRAQADAHMDLDGYLTQYGLSALFYHWDGYEYNTNNYFLYHNPADARFVFWLHGLDQIFFDCNWPVDTFPNGYIGQQIQMDPLLQQRYHDELNRLLNEVWVPQDMLDFLDSAVSVYQEAAERDPSRGFDLGRLDSVRGCLAARPDIVRSQLNALCGDGVQEGAEECDDGNINPNDGCSALCRFECGDGALQPAEQCDDGNRLGGDGCDFNCNLEPQCGDGILQDAFGEQCDDGRNGNNFSDGCRDDCTQNQCGDLKLDADEECDDGNNNNGDGCKQSCQDESGGATCRNGILEVGEECDDGNINNNDACDNNCQRPCTGGDAQVNSDLNGHCYLAFESGNTWQGAENFCQARGGHLVTITSAAENDIVRSLSFIPWLGLNDLAFEDQADGVSGDDFVWVTGEALTFNAWRAGEPNDFFGSEDCARLEGDRWNDLDCNASSAFVCELE
jgi:spore coat protein H